MTAPNTEADPARPPTREQEHAALLFALEDLERSRQKLEHSTREWMAIFDAVSDPIFLHDAGFRILRANRAYAKHAGKPLREIIGQPYWQVFPKSDGPLPHCLKALHGEEEGEEEISCEPGETCTSRSFALRDERGAYQSSIHIIRNITEQKRIQLELHESEEKFRQISSAAADAILMMDNVGNITFWNAAAENIFGYSAAEALGRELHSLIVPARFYDAFAARFPDFQNSGQGPIICKTRELQGVRKDGAEIPVELTVSSVQRHGQWHAIGIIRDITERKQTENKLLLSAQLLNSASDSIFVHDPDGNFVYLNEAAWKSRGYTHDELMGMNLHVLDVPEYEKLIETRLGELMKNGQCIFESAHRCKDGSVMPLEISSQLIETNGRKLVISAARDITERKRAEELILESERRYRSLFDNMLDGYAYCRMLYENNQPQDFFYINVNTAFGQLTGLNNVVGKKVSEVIPGIRESNPELLEICGRVAAGGKPEKTEIHVAVLDMWFALSAYNAGNECFVIVFDNITGRKLIEAQVVAQYEHVASINTRLAETNKKLEQAQNQLLQSEKMASIGQLAAGVAHEINNPIGYVNSNLGTLEKYLSGIFAILDKYEASEALMEHHGQELDELRQLKKQIDLGYLREDAKALLAESHQGLERVKKIVLDLKDFSRTGADEQWTWADIQLGLESTLGVVWNELKYKCEVRKEYGVLPQIYCLPSQLNQVFMNLLVNAAQAIEERGVVTLRSGHEGGQVWIEIADTGRGIAPENLTRIFDPFFTTKPVGKGTGLGLSVSYSIVEKHHGRIEVHSEVGKGSAFRVWLPVEQPAAA